MTTTTLVTVVIAQVIALALAIGLAGRIRFATQLRTIFVIPMVISGIVVAYVFNFLFSNTLPALASAVGVEALQQSILGDPDLDQDAARRSRDLGVDLVGGDLDQRLVRFDGVADLLEPARDGALGDRLAQLGQRHLRAGPTA